MADMPWSKFFWADWEADQSLRLCSLAAQGLWMRMLCVCARSEPYGYLAINDRGLDVSDIARLAGVTPTEASDLVDELERNGVFSRDRKGRIYSRRLLRDKKRSDEGRKHVQKRWDQPTDKNNATPPPSRGPNRQPKPQKPDTRNQIPERENTPLSQKSSARSHEPVAAQPFEVPDRTDEQSRFPEFWAAYPLKANAAKAEAAFITAIARGNAAQAIIDGAARFASSRTGQDPRYTPQPARWLEDRRWTDELPPSPQPHSDKAKRFSRIARRYA